MRALAAAMLLGVLAGCGAPAATAKKPSPAGPPPPPMPEEAIVCPADVRLCPDGSFVSRDPAKACAFKPCPGETP